MCGACTYKTQKKVCIVLFVQYYQKARGKCFLWGIGHFFRLRGFSWASFKDVSERVKKESGGGRLSSCMQAHIVSHDLFCRGIIFFAKNFTL